MSEPAIISRLVGLQQLCAVTTTCRGNALILSFTVTRLDLLTKLSTLYTVYTVCKKN